MLHHITHIYIQLLRVYIAEKEAVEIDLEKDLLRIACISALILVARDWTRRMRWERCDFYGVFMCFCVESLDLRADFVFRVENYDKVRVLVMCVWKRWDFCGAFSCVCVCNVWNVVLELKLVDVESDFVFPFEKFNIVRVLLMCVGKGVSFMLFSGVFCLFNLWNVFLQLRLVESQVWFCV